MTFEAPFSPVAFPQDWRNLHYSQHTSWITSRHPEPARASIRQRLAIILVALGGWIGSIPPDNLPDPARNRTPAS